MTATHLPVNLLVAIGAANTCFRLKIVLLNGIFAYWLMGLPPEP